MNVVGYPRNVMKMFPPAIGQSPISDFFQTIESFLSDNKDLRKIITNWWIAGKINSENFQKLMELLYEEQRMLEEKALTSQPFLGTKTFTDAPKDQKKDWKNYNEKIGLTDEKLEKILKRVPFIK